MNFVTRSIAQVRLYSFLLVLGATGCAAAGQEDEAVVQEVSQDLTHVPAIPAELAVPEGGRLSFWLKARGVQVYACKQAADGGAAWTFVEPDADLFGPLGLFQVGHHYAGPTWELDDGSTVVGARVAGVTVDTTAIPWLLLKAVSTTGPGLLSKVTYIQRVQTTGGIAPNSGCDASHVGASADVPYTAIYTFYR